MDGFCYVWTYLPPYWLSCCLGAFRAPLPSTTPENEKRAIENRGLEGKTAVSEVKPKRWAEKNPLAMKS